MALILIFKKEQGWPPPPLPPSCAPAILVQTFSFEFNFDSRSHLPAFAFISLFLNHIKRPTEVFSSTLKVTSATKLFFAIK